MEVIKVTPRGYCKGVVCAIEIAKKTRLEHPNDKITILGMLVHNKYVVEALAYYQIQTVDIPNKSRYELLDEIDEGYVIFTAHGVSDSVKEKAIKKGLKVVDATCEYVSFIHSLIKEKLNEGYDIGYVGKKGHPESEAVLEISDHIHLIENENDLNFDSEKLFFTNQTTLSSYEIEHLYEIIAQKYPNAIISNEICNATKCRQKAIMDLQNVDALIVVGDPKSHNTQKLANIGKQKIKHVFCVESVYDLLKVDFSSFEKVAVTSGASTPTKITQQLIHYLQTKELKPVNIENVI